MFQFQRIKKVFTNLIRVFRGVKISYFIMQSKNTRDFSHEMN